MSDARGIHTASLLDGPPCREVAPRPWCGSVLVAGGGAAGVAHPGPLAAPPPISSAELYAPSPVLGALTPAAGPSAGGGAVVITGSGFNAGSTVSFGDIPVNDVTVESPERIVVASPPHERGELRVEVINALGSSATTPPTPSHLFRFDISRPPNTITDLGAKAVAATEVELTFSAPPDDGALGPPALEFVVKQSAGPIGDDAAYDAADTVCGTPTVTFADPTATPCSDLVAPAAVGDVLSLTLTGLALGDTYHYAVKAVNEAGLVSDLSNPASVTLGPAPVARVPAPACPDPPAAEPGQVVYPAGYSMVGLPAGSVIPAQSPLYGWLDQGAGGTYSILRGSAPAGGSGYFAWFACPTAVTLGPGASPATMTLHAYHASIVGNPSDQPVTVTGYDYAARWDPDLSDGAGGYLVSGYREPQTLAVGDGMWVFSFVDTTVRLRPVNPT